MSGRQQVPVVDFSLCSLDGGIEVVPTSPDIRALAEEVVIALRNIGFVYLVNHGIPQQQAQDVNKDALAFFHLPDDVKEQYVRPDDGSNHGWAKLQREKLNPERPADYKEAFNATSFDKQLWPMNQVPGFHKNTASLHHSCREITHRFLQLMGVGLKLENYKLFSEFHDFDSPGNVSTIRCLHYPAIPPDVAHTPNLLRCGEHSDYGSITLLFQDDIGGLEVRNREGVYISAPPIDGSLVVNIGDLMQRWTADELLASEHRVVMPESETAFRQSRQSIAFFVHPDLDALIECIDGSHKYTPITSVGYLDLRFAATY